MIIDVKLEKFTGPLELLLYLIEKNKIDIYDIPISEITSQFLEYIDMVKLSNLDIIGEFLVIASKLLRIKSQLLLPTTENLDEDPRKELVDALIEYKMYKSMGELLGTRLIDYGRSLTKEPDIPQHILEYKEKIPLNEIVGDLNLVRLQEIFNFIIKKQLNKKDIIRGNFGNIKNEKITMKQCIDEIKDYIENREVFTFSLFFSNKKSKIHLITSFLAILELIKLGVLRANLNGDDVVIYVNDRTRFEIYKED